MKRVMIVTVLLGLLLSACAAKKLPWPDSKQTPAQINAGIAECTQIIENQPRNADAYRCRGMLYEAKGLYGLAIPDMRKAIELAPRDANAHFTLALAYRGMGNYREAYVAAAKLALLGIANEAFVGAFLNDSLSRMSIEDELDFQQKNMLIRYAPKTTANVRLEQWKTIERIQSLFEAKRYQEVSLCWAKGKYRTYVEQRLAKDADAFSKEWLQSKQKKKSLKEDFINGKIPMSFVKEDGDWKLNEL